MTLLLTYQSLFQVFTPFAVTFAEIIRNDSCWWVRKADDTVLKLVND